MPLGEDDVVTQSLFGGGGYGDPLERDVVLIQADLESGEVSREIAVGVYGVVLGDREMIDGEATTRHRARLMADRLLQARAPEKQLAVTPQSLIVRLELAEHLALATDPGSGSAYTVCTECEHALAPAEENYKYGAAVAECSLPEANPAFTDAAEVDRAVVYRSYLCPECGALFDSELTLESEPPVWDVQVDPESVSDQVTQKAEAA